MSCVYIISPHSIAFGARVFIYRKANIHSLLVYGFCNPVDARCRQWYTVKVESSKVTLENRADLLQQAEVRVCDFDIETTNLPFKFPDAEYDMIMMISHMVDGQGYLIINREVKTLVIVLFPLVNLSFVLGFLSSMLSWSGRKSGVNLKFEERIILL